MGLFFKNTTLLGSGIFHGMTDYHSHVLPGVDDGIRTMEDALAVLKRFESLGVETLWCTPHIMEDIPNTTQRLKSRFEELCAAYKGPVNLRLAAENMLDGLFIERLADGDVLPLTDEGDHLLVETSYYNPPMNMEDMLYSVMSSGYFPVLAHPERYQYLKMADYERLHRMGVKFQLNIMSLCGWYGDAEQRKAEALYKKGLYSFKGTDIHNLSGLEQRLNSKIRIKL